MARDFNGSTQYLQAALSLSAETVLSLSFFLTRLTAFDTSDSLAFESGVVYTTGAGFVVNPHNSVSSGTSMLGVGKSDGSVWTDRFPHPALGRRHWGLTFDRATPQNQAWIDGVPQVLTTQTHNAVAYGAFGTTTLNVMARNAASLFASGRLDSVAIWSGALTGGEFVRLAQGTPPGGVRPGSLLHWWPFDDYKAGSSQDSRGKVAMSGNAGTISQPPDSMSGVEISFAIPDTRVIAGGASYLPYSRGL